MRINSEQINKSKIFHELDSIEDKKKDIENYLYKTLKERDAESLRFVFYDLTDSYFEGSNCDLAGPGRTKSNGFQKKRVVLSLLVNTEKIQEMKFVKYDDKTYYQNLEIVDGRRYVLIFNPDMFIDENNSRDKLIKRAKEYLEQESKALSNAEKSRNKSTTQNRINKELKTMKADKLIDYDLELLMIKKDEKEVNSFRIIPKETDATKEDIKNQIEQAFRDVKSFIKIQPFNVWEPQHVRAHYTICVLSYLLNITVTSRLRVANSDIRSSQKVYQILRDGIVGKMSLKSTGEGSLNLMQLQSQQKKILDLFQCEGIVEKNYLKSIGVLK